jgi:hypothetical protein
VACVRGNPRRDLNRPEAQNQTPSDGRAADVPLGSRGVLPWKILRSVLLARGDLLHRRRRRVREVDHGSSRRRSGFHTETYFLHGGLTVRE